MGARALFIGLDGAEPTLIERLVAEGRMPALAQIAGRGSATDLETNLALLPAAIWPEVLSGRSSGTTRLPYHPDYLRTGEARLHRVRPADVPADEHFTSVAARAGKRVAAIDLPHNARDSSIDALQLIDWGTHNSLFPRESHPPELIAEIDERFGAYRSADCDGHGETTRGYRRLGQDLLDGVTQKTRCLTELLDGADWDLFACAFGEAHSAGHAFWHFHDPAHPRHPRRRPPAELRDLVTEVYCAIDAGIGELVARADTDTAVFILASHGMGPKLGGPQLLREFLTRLGLSSVPDTKLRRAARGAHDAARLLPRRVKPLIRRLLNAGSFRAAQASLGASLSPLESPRTRAAALENSPAGAIRINLAGREPNGRVAPGPEAEGLIALLRSELTALRHLDHDEPVVDWMTTAAEAFGPDPNPDVPDLMVAFRTDLGLIEGARSPAVGTIRAPVSSNREPRTGTHTTNSRFWLAAGKDLAEHLPAASNLDVAPTVLASLGVAPGPAMQGRSLLATSRA